MPQITSNKIIFGREDWLAGLHPQYTATGNYAQAGGNYAATQRCFNPFRFLGYACPGYNPTAVTKSSVLSALIRNGFNNGPYAYLLEGGAKIHRLTIASNALLDDAGGVGFPHTITHGAHTTIVGNDCVLYNHKVGGTSALRYMYSFSDSADWDIGTCDMNVTTPAFDDDFMSTAPATPLGASYITDGKGYPHPLIVGDDDILYIGDRNYVHAYDGQDADNDGKFIAEALVLPKGYIITSFAKIAPRTMCVFAYYSSSGSGDSFYHGTSKCFFWNYLDQDPFDIEDLEDNYVSEAFSYNGTVACFTQGRPSDLANSSKSSKLKIYNGDKFEEVANFIGNAPIRGGTEVIGKEIRWVESGGSYIFSYGNNFGITPSLNIIGESQNSANASGMLRTFSSGSSVVSTTTSDPAYYLNLVNSNYYSQSQISTTLVELSENVDINEIRVRFLGTATGGRAFSLSITDEFASSTYTIISNIETITATNKTTTALLRSGGETIPSMRRFKLVLSWSIGSGATQSPIVSEIEISYKPSKY